MTYLSIIILNMNGLHSPSKTSLVGCIKADQSVCCLQETHLNGKEIHRLKVEGWKTIFQAN
jgi:exonuclease III